MSTVYCVIVSAKFDTVHASFSPFFYFYNTSLLTFDTVFFSVHNLFIFSHGYIKFFPIFFILIVILSNQWYSTVMPFCDTDL
ncbi:hypothetical protein KL86CLO1_12634 [uncultured Eubacteriales bacterium]|uniref:Uncharacterized protein n=1 Tax=uncultured Eubacteriales bacterium TaxID=172733 RepID=A0A212KC78_9FIRM|nr:hypothetical protein KL86CLO1_12634 [uncultured Eubacteriales bacterium]